MIEELILTGQIIKEFCKIWPFVQHFHCAYQLPSSGLVERTSGTIKTQLAKIIDVYSLSWPKRPFHLFFSTLDLPLLANIFCLPLKLLQEDQ